MNFSSSGENPWIIVHEMTVEECRQSGGMSDAASTMESLVDDGNESDDSTKEHVVENDTSEGKGKGCSCRRVPPLIVDDDFDSLESATNNFSLSATSCPKTGRVQHLPIPRAHIPRYEEDVLHPNSLRGLFPHLFNEAAETDIDKWVETCKRSLRKDYEPEGSTANEEIGSNDGAKDEKEDDDEHHNKQDPSSMNNLTDAEYRQNNTK